LNQTVHEFVVATRGKGLYEFTREVAAWVKLRRVTTGLLTLHIRHTSASLLIQENADPDVMRDLETFFSRLIPEETTWFRHTAEGPDDMPAHIRAALTQTQLSIPVINGQMALGTWQGIYVFEHRGQAHRRCVMAHLIGE
jgi:secondary thiamine-phosphate synthase enzyme